MGEGRLVESADGIVFRCNTADKGTRWCFLDQLAITTDVPFSTCEMVRSVSEALDGIAEDAAKLRAQGMLGHSMKLLDEMDRLCESRIDCLLPFMTGIRPERPERGVRAFGGAGQHNIEKVSSELHTCYHCVIDQFMDAAPLLRYMQELHGRGGLSPGEVTAAQKNSKRDDLMHWAGQEEEWPPALSDLFALTDALVGGISRDQRHGGELRDVLLMRHEGQLTCYPGNGARYVKHIDDALARRGRLLTWCAFCSRNPCMP